jgi:hypothetical protein
MYVIDPRESIKILDKAPVSRFSHVKSKFSLHRFGLDMKIWLDNVPEDKRTQLRRVMGIERVFNVVRPSRRT